MKTKKLDKRAKEMAMEALEFAMDNGLHYSYNHETAGIYLFRTSDCVNTETIGYLKWEDREERFKRMMQEAKELI